MLTVSRPSTSRPIKSTPPQFGRSFLSSGASSLDEVLSTNKSLRESLMKQQKQNTIWNIINSVVGVSGIGAGGIALLQKTTQNNTVLANAAGALTKAQTAETNAHKAESTLTAIEGRIAKMGNLSRIESRIDTIENDNRLMQVSSSLLGKQLSLFEQQLTLRTPLFPVEDPAVKAEKAAINHIKNLIKVFTDILNSQP